jgi:hypothetical protein
LPKRPIEGARQKCGQRLGRQSGHRLRRHRGDQPFRHHQVDPSEQGILAQYAEGAVGG